MMVGKVGPAALLPTFSMLQITAYARKQKVVTQLDNQGRWFDTIWLFCEWVWDGAIATVK